MAVDDRQIPIQSPCPINLDRSEATAADRAMYCAHCSKDVHLLSHMTEGEARELMTVRAGEDICVSYAIRSDGRIRFREPSASAPLVPAAALFRPRRASSIRRIAQVVSLGATTLMAACAPHGEPQEVGPIATDDTVPIPQMPVIPDEPCDPNDDLLVDGGIRAEPIVDPEPMRRGGIRALPIEPEVDVEPVKAGGIRAAPLGHPSAAGSAD